MAELSIAPDKIREALNNFVDSYEPTQADTEEVGHVTQTADGIARVEGYLARWQTNFFGLKMAPWVWQ